MGLTANSVGVAYSDPLVQISNLHHLVIQEVGNGLDILFLQDLLQSLVLSITYVRCRHVARTREYAVIGPACSMLMIRRPAAAETRGTRTPALPIFRDIGSIHT